LQVARAAKEILDFDKENLRLETPFSASHS